ncbi:MAG: SMC family ATPase [Anaerolineaceae bacterium]|nr:SMC family ATPase [Anaerolineaceae bacterium]
MLPLRLILRNFMSWRELDALHLEDIHLACLAGPNGAGKSALLDAIGWALWGRARGRSAADLLREGSQEMRVQLDFRQDDQVYRVLRQRWRARRGEGSLDLFLRDARGNYTRISEASMRATQRRITALVRLDFETFINSAWLQQGRADAFTTRTPAERKQLLAGILDLSLWQRLEEAAKDRLAGLETQLALLQSRNEETKNDLARQQTLEAALQVARDASAAAQRELDAAEQAARASEHVPHDLRFAREGLAGERDTLRQHRADAEAAGSDCERQEERIAAFEAVLAQREEIERGRDALQKARQSDRQMGERLRRLGDLREREQTLRERLRDARAELETRLGALGARIAGLEREVQAASGAALEQARERIADLRALERERTQLQSDANREQGERARLQGVNRNLRETMLDLRSRMDRLERADGATCPLCGQPLDEDARAALIARLQQEGGAQGDRWRANDGRMRQLAEEDRRRQARTAQLDDELRQLQPLLARVAELEARARAAAEASEALQLLRSEQASLRTRLDSGDYARELQAQLAALESSGEAIGYDSAQHDAAQAQLAQFESFEQRQTALQIALNGLPEAREALAAAKARRERIQAEQRAAQERFAQLEADIAELETGLAEHQAQQEHLAQLRVEAQQADRALVSAGQELSALESLRERHATLQERAARLQEGAEIYRELRQACGRDGVPALLMESAIPELEAAANALLLRMTDGRLRLQLETTRERVRGGDIETLDIRIADEYGLRDYELFSGGEAFRVNLALRIALSRLLARRAGTQLRSLFIDEGFGTQDDAGRERLVEAIAAIQDDFDLILVITHIEELRDRFPLQIRVERDAAGSRLSLQPA